MPFLLLFPLFIIGYFAAAFVNKKLFSNSLSEGKEFCLHVFIVIFSGAILCADTLWIAYKANQLCTSEGGLRIYRTVKAEGFLGARNIEYWSSKGFVYVEEPSVRYTMRNGRRYKEVVSKNISRYRVSLGDEVVLNRYFKKTRYYIDDVVSKDILGELVYFSIYPGWLDSLVIGTTGFTFTPSFCGDKFMDESGRKYTVSSSDLIKKVIFPK